MGRIALSPGMVARDRTTEPFMPYEIIDNEVGPTERSSGTLFGVPFSAGTRTHV